MRPPESRNIFMIKSSQFMLNLLYHEGINREIIKCNMMLEQTKTATELAYVEVISYNRKNLERELQSESRHQAVQRTANRQQSKAKDREEEI